MGMLSYDDFINRVIQQESGGNARAVSPAGAIGLMQLMPATARQVAGELGRNDIAGLDEAGLRNALFDPKLNRQFGEHYMQGRLNRYDGNQLLAAIGYNAGDKRADAYRQSHDMAALPRETQGYVRGILGEDVFGGAGTDTLAGGGGADPMLGGSAAAGSPFEGASDRDKWVAWGQALSQAFRGRDNSEAMGRLSALEQQGVSQNKTYQALIKRGLDPATAEWAVRDPVVMREMVQQLFSPKSKNMTIGEIFDPATGQPQKVLLDPATGGYQAIGGAKAADQDKAANLQTIEIYDEQSGGKRKMLLNPTTGQMQPIGGVAAPDAPKESALDREVAKKRVDMAQGAIESATSARGMQGVVAQLKAISNGDVGDLERAIGPVQGRETYQSTIGQLWGSPELNAKIRNLSAQLNADLGRVWLAGQGSASDTERRMVSDAIGQLPLARNKAEFDNLLGSITSRIDRKVAEGGRAAKNVPGLDVVGAGAERRSLRKASSAEMAEAKAALQAGADRNKVLQRLRQHGIDPAGL